MPLAISNAPWPKLGHTRSPNWLQLYTTEVLVGGTTAQWSITFTSGTSGTTEVEISVADQVITMFGVSVAPDDSGTQFARDTDPTISATNFTLGCLANSWLAEHFIIYSAGPVVTFAAYEKGVNYNLIGVVFTNTTGTSATSYTGVDRSLSPNFSANIRVWIGTAGGGSASLEVGEFSAEPLNGSVEFDLGSILNPYLSTDMLTYGYAAASQHVNSVRYYYVQAWERYGDPVADRAVYYQGTLEAPCIAWYAGNARAHTTNFFLFVLDNTLNDPADNPRWFTWRNRDGKRRVSPTEQHSLTWYAWYQPPMLHNVALQARITYTDANGANPTTTAWTNRYVEGGITQHLMYTWPVGYTALNLAAVLPANKVLQSYDVRLFAPTDSVVLCETMTFLMAQTEWNEIHLQFWSSLGAPESLRCTGAWRVDVEASNLETFRPQTYAMAYDPFATSYRTVPGTAQRSLTVFTGYHGLSEQEALLDILNSPEIRLVDHENQGFKPLRLLESKAVAGKRGTPEEHLHGLELTFLDDDPQALVTIAP